MKKADAECEAANAKHQQLITQHKQLTTELDQGKVQINKITTQYTEANAKQQQLAVQLNQASAKNTQLTTQHTEANAKIQQLTTQLAQANAKHQHLVVQQQQLAAECDKAKADVNEMTAKHKQLEGELARARAEVTTKCTEANAKIQQANVNTQQVAAQRDQANGQINEMNKRHAAATPQALVAARLQQNQSIYFKNVHSRQYLAAWGLSKQTGVVQQPHPTPWEFVPVGDGWYKVHPESRRDLCWDVKNASPHDGGQIMLYPPHQGHNQQFQLRKVADHSGTPGMPDEYEIVVRSTGKVLDVLGFSMASGATVAQWHHTNTNNQKWFVTAPHPYF